MKFIYRILGTVCVILILNLLATWVFVKKNNGNGFVEKYIKSSQEIKVKVDPQYFEGKIDIDSYFKFTIIFKGVYGKQDGFQFRDNLSGKYYKIMRFDKYGVQFGLPQSTELDDEELYVKADPLQLNNSSFGTKENPILIFYYKGVNKQFTVDLRTDEIGKDGFYINKVVPLSPTEEEYRYNVEQYLTYVMPKKEFKERFR